MKKIFYALALFCTLYVVAQTEPCGDTTSAFTTQNLRLSPTGTYLTCGTDQFILEVTNSVTWFDLNGNRGGGTQLFANQEGTYYAEQDNGNGTCTSIGPIVIEVGSKPTVSIDLPTNFYCTGGAGTELTAVVSGTIGDVTHQWFKNFGESLSGETANTFLANENASFRVEINDGGCIASSDQVNMQGKDCENIICPDLELQNNGLVEVGTNQYKICDENYSLQGSTQQGSFQGMYFSWLLNGSEVSTTNSYDGSQTGNFELIINDFLVCSDTLEFQILDGNIADVTILGANNGVVQYCSNEETGANVTAQAQPEDGIIYTWYEETAAGKVFYADGKTITDVPEGQYTVIIGNTECDRIDTATVEVEGIDCAANCLLLSIQQSSLIEVNDSVFASCQNNFNVQLNSGNSNVSSLSIEWLKDDVVIGNGASYNGSGTPEEFVGKYVARASDGAGCIDTYEFEISDEPLVEVSIVGGSPFTYCGTERPVISTEIVETKPDLFPNYYYQWLLETPTGTQNVGGGRDFNNIQNGQTGTYQVVLGGGSCANLSSATVVVEYEADCNVVGLGNSIESEKYSIVPNPVLDVLEVEGEEISSLVITDLSGKVMLESTSKNINVSDLEKGNYFIIITSENAQTAKRFVKQ